MSSVNEGSYCFGCPQFLETPMIRSFDSTVVAIEFYGLGYRTGQEQQGYPYQCRLTGLLGSPLEFLLGVGGLGSQQPRVGIRGCRPTLHDNRVPCP